MKTLGLVFMSFLLTGCMVMIPRQWSTDKEAFPGGNASENFSPGAKAYRESVMNFPYSDVFAASEKAMSYAQINLTESDEPTGVIYGTRSVLVQGKTKKYFYMIKVDELGPEKCKVSIHSKQQQSGAYFKWGPNVVYPSLGLAAFSIAIMGFDYPGSTLGACLVYPVISAPLIYYLNATARKNARVIWSPDDDESMDRLMSFIRTDLLQK